MNNYKNFDTKALRKSVTLYISVAMLLLIILTTIVTSVIQNSRQDQKEKEYSSQIHRSINHTINHFIKDYSSRVDRMINTTGMPELLAKRDRQGMHKLIQPKWELMLKEDKNLAVIHIHLADGTSFYRAHMPDTFGDKLKKVRLLVNEVHKSHKAINGFETGVHHSALRIAAPIFDKEHKYLGALEVGLEAKFILDTISKINNFKGMIFIISDDLGSFSKNNTELIDGYSLESELDDELKSILPSIKHLNNGAEIIVEDKKYYTHLFELNDFKNTPKVKILFFHDISELGIFRSYLLFGLSAIMVFVLLILIFFIYRRIGKHQNNIATIYQEQLIKLNESESYLQGIFDITPNIMITTDGIDIEKSNPAMLDFFDYKTIKEFKSKNNCICDYFLECNGCLQAVIGDITWLDYILKKKNKLHKVCMMKENKKHYFIVSAYTIIFNNKNNHSVVFFNDVTKIEELSNLLKNTINSVENIIFVKDNEFKYLECNRAFEKFIGLLREDIIGKTDYDFFNKKQADFFRYKDKETLNTLGSVENLEWTTDGNGREIYLFTTTTPLRDFSAKVIGLVGNSVDLTEQKKLELELLDSKLEFDMFMEFIPANILIKERDGVIIYANESSNQFFNEENIVGKRAQDLFPLVVAKEIDTFADKVIEYGKHEEVNEFYNYKNEKIIVRTLGFKIETKNSVQIGLVMIDITQSYLDKDEIKKKEEIMIAQSRHAAMGEMISMIAHQWRQPISVIAMGSNNILADIELNMLDESTLESAARDIIFQTQELSKTIDDFRNFFRPGKIAEEILPEDIFNEAVSIIGKSLENNDIDIISQFDNGKKIYTYSRELMQVFINILKNAKEILVEKREDDRKIFIVIQDNTNELLIKICDNGGGIKKGLEDKIFNPYFTTKDKANGTGLGLYMSKTIVEKHLKGVLSVYNKDGGACFEIRLPYKVG